MENKPLVSVIIPNYNHAPYLKQRIESVLNQTYDNFEVIILDDCSSDNSVEIINAYKSDRHVTNIVINTKNSGNTFHQWEKGIKLATGSLLWIAESDDYADIHLLEKAVEGFNRHPSSILTFFHSEFVDQNSDILDWTWERNQCTGTTLHNGKKYAREYLTFHNMLYNASMIVFKKQAALHVNPKYKTLRHCGDWMFWFDMTQQGDLLEIPEKLNFFRQHSNKVSNNARSTNAKDTEDASIIDHISRKLNLTKYQVKCLRGRMTKRMKKVPSDIRQALATQYPKLYSGTWSDIVTYEIDKLFNLSKLYFRKHRA